MADSHISMNDDVTIDDYIAALHTFLIPHEFATLVAVTGFCTIKNALLYLAEPREELIIDRDGNEFIAFRVTHPFKLDREIELNRNDIVITQFSIDNYLNSYVKLHGVQKDTLETINNPLGNKERETLLVIIAALAKEAGVDITKTSKAGEIIASMTQQLGASIGATTIETHLKKIPQALENRTK